MIKYIFKYFYIAVKACLCWFLMFIILFPLTLNIRAQGTDDNYMVLDNGLVVLMRPGPGSGLVCLMALVEAGSTTEAEYLGSGISHFVEHMLFKGTPSRGVGVIPAQVKSYGGDMNAWTSFDSTGYRIVVLKEYLKQAAEVLADALRNPLFDPIELEKERQVILREINLNQDDPDRRISRLLFSSAYEKHFYKYPVIGYKDIFEKLTRDNLVNYHQRLYRPDNIVLALTGDFDPRTAREYIKNIFGKWSKAANAPVLAVSPEPVQSAMRKVINTAAVQTCYLEIGFHGPALRNEDLFPMDVLAHILGGDKESRIYKLLVDKKQLASSVNCWSYTPKDKGLFGFDIRFTQSKNLDRMVEVILNQINRVIKKGVKSKEIKRAQRQILSDYVWGLETAVNQARDICSSYVLTQNPDFFQTYIEGINNVTSKGIVKAAKKYLRSDNLTQVSIIPRTDIPEKLKPALEKSRKKQARRLLTRLADIRAGFNVKDEGKNKIFSKREILKVVKKGKKESAFPGEVEQITLPSKVVLLLKTDQRLPRCSVNVVFTGGLGVESRENNGINNLAVNMLSRGTRKRNKARLTREIADLAGDIDFFSGNNSLGLKMNILSVDLDKGLELLSDLILNPVFPKDQIAKEKELILARIRKADDDNFSVCYRGLKQIMFKDHPFKMPRLGTRESVKRITQQALIDFHKKIFTPGNMTLSVFGDFDRDKVLKQVKKYFGKDFNKAAEKMTDPGQKRYIPDAAEQLKVINKVMEREQVILMFGFPLYDVYSQDRAAFNLVDVSLSGHSSRLFERIREKLGLAYMVGGFEVLGLDKGYYVIYAGVEPAAVDRAKKEIIKQIDLIRKKGLKKEEITSGRNEILGSLRMDSESVASQGFNLALDQAYGLGYDFRYKYEKQVMRTGPKQIKDVLSKYLDTGDYYLAVTGPEKIFKKAD